MPQVSRNPLRKAIEKRMYEVFERVIADLRKAEDVRNFITDLLTPTEKIMLAKRLAIAVLLDKDYDYRRISRTLKVSFATINSIARQKAIAGAGYKTVAAKILSEEKLKKTFLNVSEELSKLFAHPAARGRIAADYRYRRIKESEKVI